MPAACAAHERWCFGHQATSHVPLGIMASSASQLLLFAPSSSASQLLLFAPQARTWRRLRAQACTTACPSQVRCHWRMPCRHCIVDRLKCCGGFTASGAAVRQCHSQVPCQPCMKHVQALWLRVLGVLPVSRQQDGSTTLPAPHLHCSYVRSNGAAAVHAGAPDMHAQQSQCSVLPA